MIIIYSGSEIEAINIKNLLDNANIESFIQNQFMSVLEPWLVTAGGYNPASVQIHSNDYEKAKKILDNLDKGEYDLDV